MDYNKFLEEEFKSVKKLYNFLKKKKLITITFEELLHLSIENDIFDKQILQQKYKTYKKETEVKKGCRDAKKCFNNGQKIRNKYGIDEWIGIYNKDNNSIEYNKKIYKGVRGSPLHAFTVAHRISLGKHKKVNSWAACECEINGKWISCENLPEL